MKTRRHAQSAPPPVTAPELCPGGTVVCLASGPSLTQEDVDYCRGKALVIAVNDAVRLAPWADVLYSSDQYWFPKYQWVPSFKGLKVALDDCRHPDVLTLARTRDAGMEWSPHGLSSTKNSGGAAINLAVHLCGGKPRRIILLGYDMGATGDGHFFGKHPEGLRTTSLVTYRGTFVMLIESMAKELKARNIEVVNCTRMTALRCFPRMDLRQALPDVQMEAAS